MNIEIEKEDLIKEIIKNWQNDEDVLYTLIDEGTTNWEVYRSIVIKMLKELKRNGELGDISI